mgnify:CR=1 FL=1
MDEQVRNLATKLLSSGYDDLPERERRSGLTQVGLQSRFYRSGFELDIVCNNSNGLAGGEGWIRVAFPPPFFLHNMLILKRNFDLLRNFAAVFAAVFAA